MKKIISRISRLILAIGFAVGLFFIVRSNESVIIDSSEVTPSKVESALSLLNSTLDRPINTYFNQEIEVNYGDKVISGEANGNTVIDYEEEAKFTVDVDEAGYYSIALKYVNDESALSNSTIAVKVNGEFQFDEALLLDLPIYWVDSTKDFTLDTYGDQTLPPLNQITDPVEAHMYNNLYYTDEPMMFYFEEGLNEVSIFNISSNLISIMELNIAQIQETPSYVEYENQDEEVDGLIEINAIDYVSKNSSYARLYSFNDPSVSPHDSVDKMLNVIDGGAWKKAGQEVTFEVSVETTGNYNLSLHYLNDKTDFSVFRSIYIDGKVPFKEVRSYEFKTTGKNEWDNVTLGNEEGSYKFYLTEGTHTITLKNEAAPVAESVEQIRLLINHINQFALEIVKITGTNADKYRTWEITRYLPETEQYLESYITVIKSIIYDLSQYSDKGADSSTLAYLNTALQSLEKMADDADNLPLYLPDLYSGTGSATQMLGDSINFLTDQPMYLDALYIHGDQDLPNPNANMFESVISGAKSFVASFTSQKYVTKNDPNVLNVWVNRPITHVDTLQKLVDSNFTPETGIKVKISVMPDPNKLILAASAKDTPDVSLGTLPFMPFDFAIRGAAYDLTQFDDFWEFADNFAPGAIVPYVYNDGVYAIPETLDFNALVYRKDVFNALDLDVPNTWDDVVELLPELQSYGMSFYHPIADGKTSLKWFYQTSQFIYQFGGSLYTEDGASTAIDNEQGVEGINFLVNLFKKYSLPTQIMLFSNDFRYGTAPIGIVDFNNFLQIKNTAPELVGQWALSDYPAVIDDEGNLNRWFIANGTNGMIFNESKREDEAWEFLKWWMDAETQTVYAYNLQSTYGPEYIWLSGNVNALADSPLENAHKQVIMDQVQWINDIPRTPGQYMLERGLSDIWNKAVFDNYSTRVAVDVQTLTIDREIKRKMVEFGYLDEEGNVLKEFKIRDITWIEEQIQNAKEEN